MRQWWKVGHEERPDSVPLHRAVAYYRHSAQDRQENSIPIQRDQVTKWAEEHGVEIIKEFADHGKSGLNAEGRPAFNEMMNDWVKARDDFQYILCLDVSRWGRFQDIDMSGQFSAECKRNKKEVIYTTIGKPKEDDPLYPVYIQFERFRAAQYSRELSGKVWHGCAKVAEQGYSPGAPAPYGLRRLLLDESREPVQVLEPGQRKSIQNQRVTLTEGDPDEVEVIRRIFREFVESKYSEHRIAEGLNRDRIPSPSGNRWGAESVRNRLRNEKYTGTMVYNRTTQKLKTPTRSNPFDEWVRTPEAFQGIVTREQFDQAQEILGERQRKYDPDHMLRQLHSLYEKHGLCRGSLLRTNVDLPRACTYGTHFGSLDFAFQRMFQSQLDAAKQSVEAEIRGRIGDVEAFSDFFVLHQKLTVAIRPAVPVPNGYEAYWPFRRDHRDAVDLTLAVPLSDGEDFEVLGYIALPKWLVGPRTFRFTGSSARTELYGQSDLSFLDRLLETNGG